MRDTGQSSGRDLTLRVSSPLLLGSSGGSVACENYVFYTPHP